MRTILAALVGAVVLFVLGFVMWIGLDYHWKVMSPLPNFDALVPPNENGSRGTGTPTFTPIMPLLARSAT